MDSDKLETHMENKLAAKDVVAEEPSPEEDEPTHTADEAFQASHCVPIIIAQASCTPTSSLLPRVPPVAPPGHFAHLRPSLGHPVPMDIDVVCKA